MTDFFDLSFSLPLMVGIVAAVLAGGALWRQRQDRSVSVTTLNLVKTSIASHEEYRRQDELDWKMLRYSVYAMVIVFGILVLGIVLFWLFVRPAGKGAGDRSSSSSLVSR